MILTDNQNEPLRAETELVVKINYPTIFKDKDFLGNIYTFSAPHEHFCRSSYAVRMRWFQCGRAWRGSDLNLCFVEECSSPEEFSETAFQPSPDGLFTLTLATAPYNVSNLHQVHISFAGSYIELQ